MNLNRKFFNKHYFNKLKKKGKYLRRDPRLFLGLYLKRLIKKFNSSGNVIDIGTGNGYFITKFEKSYKTIGVDISEYAINLAKKRCLRTNFVICSAEHLPFMPNCFDFILALDLIEHLKNPDNFFQDSAYILKDKGIIILSTPNPTSYGKKLKKEKWIGHSDISHISIKSPEQWRKLFNLHNFEIIREGTDFCWDIPYPIPVHPLIQRWIVMPIHIILKVTFGFLPWKFGENYYAIIQFIGKANKNENWH